MGERYSSASECTGSRVWLPPQEAEPGIHNSRAQLQGMLRLRSDISLFAGFHVSHAPEEIISGLEALAGQPKAIATQEIPLLKRVESPGFRQLRIFIPAKKVPVPCGAILLRSAEIFLPRLVSRRIARHTQNDRSALQRPSAVRRVIPVRRGDLDE